MKWKKIKKETPKFQYLNEDIFIANEQEAYQYLVSSSKITLKEYQQIYNLFKKGLSNILPGKVTSSKVTQIQPTFFKVKWDPVTNSIKYKFQISENQNFTNSLNIYYIQNQQIILNEFFVNNLLSGTNYYYKIRAINEIGYGEYSPVFSVLTIPDAPVILPPSDNTSTSFVANWVPTRGATFYKLDVALDPVFQNYLPGYCNKTVLTTSQSITNVPSFSMSYYRVRAGNSSGIGSYSAVRSSMIINPPTALDATRIFPHSFVANWSTVPNATSYRLDVSSNPNFTSFVQGYNNKQIFGTHHKVSNLMPETTYYYRVRAMSYTDSSLNSNTIMVTTTREGYPHKILTIETATPDRARIILNPPDIYGRQFQESQTTGALTGTGGTYSQPQSFEYEYDTDVTLTALNTDCSIFVKWEIKDEEGNWIQPVYNNVIMLVGQMVDNWIKATWEYRTPYIPEWAKFRHQEQPQISTIK